MREYRNYDVDSARDAEADLKPDASGATPVRAWLMPKVNGLPPGFESEAGPWTMVIEDGPPREATVGEFRALVATGAAAGVVEFFVWSRERHSYQQFDVETVAVID